MMPVIAAALKKLAKEPAAWMALLIIGLAIALMFTRGSRDEWAGKYTMAQDSLLDAKARIEINTRFYDAMSSLAAARRDTIRNFGTYLIDSASYSSGIAKLKAEIKRVNKLLTLAYGDTAPQLNDSPCPPCPPWVFKINKTRTFGEINPFTVHVTGEAFWPDTSKSWMAIDPVGWRDPIIPPSPDAMRPRQASIRDRFGVGLGLCRSFSKSYGPGAHLRFGRLSLTYDRGDFFKSRSWAGAVRYDILRF